MATTLSVPELYEAYRRAGFSYTTDSRRCPAGSIFFALRGEAFDGNRFAADALRAGCSLAVVDDPACADDPRCVLVDDVLRTFKDFARHHRRRFSIPVLAITGTNGKTTTKELTAAALSTRYRVHFTQGNFNNDVGVPKTLLCLDDTADIAVVEMGASHPGDIRTLVDTAEPTCGLITNVGRAHLQGFGSFEGVMRTKGELYDYLLAHRLPAFIDASNPYLTEMASSRGLTDLIPYGAPADSPVAGEVIRCAPYLTFRWRASADTPWHEVQTHLIGAYNLTNCLAAIAVGLHFSVSPDDISAALSAYVPSNNRSQLTATASNHLIVDAYNANPTSLAAAIENFRLMEVSPKVAIIGQMGELGDVSDAEHRHVVDLLQAAGFAEVWLVGSSYADIPCPFRKFHDVDEVRSFLTEHPLRDAYILLKGSHSVRLYELPDCL